MPYNVEGAVLLCELCILNCMILMPKKRIFAPQLCIVRCEL